MALYHCIQIQADACCLNSGKLTTFYQHDDAAQTERPTKYFLPSFFSVRQNRNEKLTRKRDGFWRELIENDE